MANRAPPSPDAPTATPGAGPAAQGAPPDGGGLAALRLLLETVLDELHDMGGRVAHIEANLPLLARAAGDVDVRRRAAASEAKYQRGLLRVAGGTGPKGFGSTRGDAAARRQTKPNASGAPTAKKPRRKRRGARAPVAPE